MPELPEVESIRRGLERHLVGKTITSINILEPRSARSSLKEALGAKVTGTGRRGKFLWLELSGAVPKQYLTAHLRMSGQMLINAPTLTHPHLRIQMGLEQGQTTLSFIDQRKFGYLDLVEKAGELPEGTGHIAPDFLDPSFDLQTVLAAWKAAKRPIKAVLLDQYIASGLGNIYADETLFRCGVDPRRRASALSRLKLEELVQNAQTVLSEAVRAGGTSFDALYLNAEGSPGYFQRELRVYGRANLPCISCGEPIRKIRVAGRSAHICPTCQPYGRRSVRI